MARLPFARAVFSAYLRRVATLPTAGLFRRSLGYIQLLLGHRDLEKTTIYLHLSQRHLNATASPLDSLQLKVEPPQDE